MGSEDARKTITIFWYLENFPYSSGKSLYSPPFVLDALDSTTWQFVSFPRGTAILGGIYFSLSRKKDGPISILLDYELSFIDVKGSPVMVCKAARKLFERDRICENFSSWRSIEKICQSSKEQFFPNDILTVRCRIWKNDSDLSENTSIHLRTRINAFHSKFTWILNDVGSHRRAVDLKHASKIKSAVLVIKFNGDFRIKFRIKEEFIPQTYVYCEIFMIDADGRSVILAGGESVFKDLSKAQVWEIPVHLENGRIMKKYEDLYFPNRELTLSCKFIFSDGIEFNIIEEQTCIPKWDNERQ